MREKQDLIVHESGSDANSQAGGDAIAVEGGKRLIGVYLRRDDVGCSTILESPRSFLQPVSHRAAQRSNRSPTSLRLDLIGNDRA